MAARVVVGMKPKAPTYVAPERIRASWLDDPLECKACGRPALEHRRRILDGVEARYCPDVT